MWRKREMFKSFSKKVKRVWYKARMKNLPNIIGIVFSAFLHIFSIWQLDLIMVHPVWDYWNDMLYWYFSNLSRFGVTRYADVYFQCFLWKTTVGQAYDTLLFLNFISFWLLFISLWFWRHKK